MPRNIDEKGKKLFIGGLHMKTSEESLKNFYSQWGEIVDCVVMKDSSTGRSRGFGFVTYKELESIDIAQSNRPHEIDGITVDSKRAMPKEDTSPEFHASVNRLFLGRLKRDVTNEDLYEYFGKFGTITDAVIIKNPNGESRGFGFITFEDTDSVDKIIVSRPHKLNGQNIEVKKAQPKDGEGKVGGGNAAGRGRGAANGPQGGRGGRGGRMHPYGDYNSMPNNRFPPQCPPMNDNWGYGGYENNYGNYGMGQGDSGMGGPQGYGMPPTDPYASQMPPYGHQAGGYGNRYDAPPQPGAYGDNSFFSGGQGEVPAAGPYDNGRYGMMQDPYSAPSMPLPGNPARGGGQTGGPGPIRNNQKYSGRNAGGNNANPYGSYPY